MGNRDKKEFKLDRKTLVKWARASTKSLWNFVKKGGWLVLVAFLADLVSKLSIQAAWAPEASAPRIPLITDSQGRIILGLTLTYNKGMGYGMLSRHTALLAALSFIVGAAMIAFLAYRFDRKPWPVRYGLYLMIAGTFGNFIDRAFYPEGVIDWIIVGNSSWPSIFTYVCNIADIALTFGVIILVVGLLAIYIRDLVQSRRDERIKQASAEETKPEKSEGEEKSSNSDESDLDALTTALHEERKDDDDDAKND